MSYDTTHHPATPFYDFSVNEGTSGSIYGLAFSRPLGFDDVTITEQNRAMLLQVIANTLLTFDGVQSVKVTLTDHTVTDVTPA